MGAICNSVNKPVPFFALYISKKNYRKRKKRKISLKQKGLFYYKKFFPIILIFYTGSYIYIIKSETVLSVFLKVLRRELLYILSLLCCVNTAIWRGVFLLLPLTLTLALRDNNNLTIFL